jgi:hypothetical protein
VELPDARATAELQPPRQPRDPGRRSAAPHAARRVLRRLADVPRARDTDAPGQPAGQDRGQEGVHIIDVSDPEEPEEIAYADPAPLVDPNPPVGIEGGGDWSSYWYDGHIYEGDMTRGLLIWRLRDRAVSGPRSSAT